MKMAKTTVLCGTLQMHVWEFTLTGPAGNLGLEITSLWTYRQGLGAEVLSLTKMAMLLSTCYGRTLQVSTSLNYVPAKPRQLKNLMCFCLLLLAHCLRQPKKSLRCEVWQWIWFSGFAVNRAGFSSRHYNRLHLKLKKPWNILVMLYRFCRFILILFGFQGSCWCYATSRSLYNRPYGKRSKHCSTCAALWKYGDETSSK